MDINNGLQSNDNHIEDINENDNLEEEYEINKEIQENENCEEVSKKAKNYMARIKGGFETCLSVMFNEHKSKYKYDLEGKNIGILNSFDGANHLHNEEGSQPVISCSSQLFSRESLDHGLFSGSEDILTWLQAMGKEDFATMKKLVEAHYRERAIKIQELERKYKCKIICYDVHDGKMLYILSQHSNYNRKNYPMLTCRCKRGECFMNRRHKCKQFTDEEVVEKYERSKAYYHNKIEEDKDWDIKKHAKWADEENYGITHFGLDPRIFKYSLIRYDTFHMICQVTRRLMNYLRRLMNRQVHSSRNEFHKILKKKLENLIQKFGKKTNHSAHMMERI